MPLSREHRAVPQFDVGYTVPPSRPRSNPPPCTAAVKSLPSHCDPTGRRQADARPCSFPRFQTFALARGQALDGREHGGIGRSSSGRFIIFDGVSHIWTS